MDYSRRVMLLLLACATDEPWGDTAAASGCEAAEDPSLSIGKGELSYVDMSEGDTIELVHGPQGGFHVVVALEASHLDSSDTWQAELRGFLAAELRATSTPYVEMRCNPDTGTLQAWGFLLIWDALPEDLDRQVVRIEADVVDAAGTSISSATDVIICDPTLD
jgi:hypothetical protein